MARDENPPFERGQTFYGSETIDSNNYGGVHLEGKEWIFEDIDPRPTGNSANGQRTGRKVRCRIVRNMAGTTLYAKRLVTFQATAARYGSRVDGYGDTSAEKAYPIDEYLPSGGVRDGDLFYIVVEGPALCMTDLAGGANNLIPVGTVLTALTAVTSGATTSGRVKPQDLTGATAPLGNEVQNRVGMALSAKTTANTNADVLVDVGKW